jgi:hypothetical protein
VVHGIPSPSPSDTEIVGRNDGRIPSFVWFKVGILDAEPLRNDALAAERACVLEDSRAILAIGLIERDVLMWEPQQPR